jgi:hypothetical protein
MKVLDLARSVRVIGCPPAHPRAQIVGAKVLQVENAERHYYTMPEPQDIPQEGGAQISRESADRDIHANTTGYARDKRGIDHAQGRSARRYLSNCTIDKFCNKTADRIGKTSGLFFVFALEE